jgi:hypothetical protein
VFPNDKGEVLYEDRGKFRGVCSLKCHGENHDLRTYP